MIELSLFTSYLSYKNDIWIDDSMNGFNDNPYINSITTDAIDFLKNDRKLEHIKIYTKVDENLPNICYIKYENQVFISFSGIRNTNDILHSLYYYLSYNDVLDCNIYRGYSNLFNLIIEDVIFLVNKITENEKIDIIFVGHSLGGVIAKLCSLYFNMNGNNYSCMTYSCPMIGSLSFINKFNEIVPNSFHVCCHTDPVVRAPFIFNIIEENNKFMFNQEEIVEYSPSYLSYFYNLITMNFYTHRLLNYYEKFKNKNFTYIKK